MKHDARHRVGRQGADVEVGYVGQAARDYLPRRRASLKWRLEQQAAESLLGALPPGSTILDAPIGTGRFLAAFTRHSHRFLGVDLSRQMLCQAQAEQKRAAATNGHLIQATVKALPLCDGAVDCVISIRLLNWLDRDALGQAVREFKRVCRRQLLLGVRLTRPLGWRRLPQLAGELLRHPVSSLRRLVRSRPGRAQPVLTNHPEAEFLGLLEALDLSVERIVAIDDGTAYSRELGRHTPLRIYVLLRQDG